MLPLLADHRSAIADLCKQHKVNRLYAFGSAIRADFEDDRSDIDLLVDFQPMPAAEKAHTFFEMRDALHALLHREIDLVMTGAVRNRIIAREIENSRQLIYGA